MFANGSWQLTGLASATKQVCEVARSGTQGWRNGAQELSAHLALCVCLIRARAWPAGHVRKRLMAADRSCISNKASLRSHTIWNTGLAERRTRKRAHLALYVYIYIYICYA